MIDFVVYDFLNETINKNDLDSGNFTFQVNKWDKTYTISFILFKHLV